MKRNRLDVVKDAIEATDKGLKTNRAINALCRDYLDLYCQSGWDSITKQGPILIELATDAVKWVIKEGTWNDGAPASYPDSMIDAYEEGCEWNSLRKKVLERMYSCQKDEFLELQDHLY